MAQRNLTLFILISHTCSIRMMRGGVGGVGEVGGASGGMEEGRLTNLKVLGNDVHSDDIVPD